MYFLSCIIAFAATAATAQSITSMEASAATTYPYNSAEFPELTRGHINAAAASYLAGQFDNPAFRDGLHVYESVVGDGPWSDADAKFSDEQYMVTRMASSIQPYMNSMLSEYQRLQSITTNPADQAAFDCTRLSSCSGGSSPAPNPTVASATHNANAAAPARQTNVALGVVAGAVAGAVGMLA